MPGSARWVLLAVLVLVAGCGLTSNPTQGAGQSASITLSLNTVSSIRAVTVSPAKAVFGNCTNGSAIEGTLSTPSKLGYPDGECWFGILDGSLPILITNKGIGSYVYVSGSDASPADGGDQWSLCNTGDDPAVACTADDHRAPGVDQYLLRNFGPNGIAEHSGLTDNPACDLNFGLPRGCWAAQGQFQTEGVELIGPASTTDNSTKWTVTITWMPVPR